MRFGADRGTGRYRGKRPGGCVRLTHGGMQKGYWLTLAEAQILLGELAAAVRAAEREGVMRRDGPPDPPEANAAFRAAA